MRPISAEDIIDQALREPEKERARIAEILISSLENSVDKNVEFAWQEECNEAFEGKLTLAL